MNIDKYVEHVFAAVTLTSLVALLAQSAYCLPAVMEVMRSFMCYFCLFTAKRIECITLARMSLGGSTSDSQTEKEKDGCQWEGRGLRCETSQAAGGNCRCCAHVERKKVFGKGNARPNATSNFTRFACCLLKLR